MGNVTEVDAILFGFPACRQPEAPVRLCSLLNCGYDL